MKNVIVVFLALVFVFAIGQTSVSAQKEPDSGVNIDKEMELIRRDLRSEKKKIIAMNVPLTDAEATKFWVIYDQYAAEMSKHYDEFYAIIKDYAANQKTLTDAQASSMIKRWSDIQVKQAQTRQKYIPIVEKAITGKKAATFFQIDRRLYALMDLQVSSEVPLVYQ